MQFRRGWMAELPERASKLFGQTRIVDRGRSILLAEFESPGIGYHRDMCIIRCVKLQTLLQKYLPWCRFKQIDTPDHGADTLGFVVYNHGKLVSMDPVAAANDKITDVARAVFTDRPLNPVHEAEFLIDGADTQCAVRTVESQSLTGTEPGVNRSGSLSDIMFPEAFAAAVAGVQSVQFAQSLYCGLVLFNLPALIQRPLVPFESTGFKRM